MPATRTAAKKQHSPEALAQLARTTELLQAFSTLFPVGAIVPVVGRGVQVERIGKYSATLRGPRGKEYTLTPCLNASVMGHPDVRVFAAVYVSGIQGRSVRFGLDAADNVVALEN